MVENTPQSYPFLCCGMLRTTTRGHWGITGVGLAKPFSAHASASQSCSRFKCFRPSS